MWSQLVLFNIVLLNSLNLVTFVRGGSLSVIPKPDPVGNSVTASIGESFVLSCVSSGPSEERPKALQWRSPSNQPILADTNKRVYTELKGDTLRLFFDKLVESDSGTYSCVGIEAGVPKDVRVDLILQKKISFYETPVEQFIRGGQDQTVVCRATANPGPEIAYFRKGINVELKNDAKYQMTNDGLMIKNAQPEDEGVYICQASVTTTGEVKRLEVSVQVMSAPRWVIEPKDTEGVKDQDVIIKCEAHAKPTPIYTWSRNGVALAGNKYSVNGGTLTIRNLVKEDTATYTCIAENNSGKIEANIRLAVLIGPDVAKMEDVRVIEGNKAILRCNVREAYPKATIRWKYADTYEFVNDSDTSQFRVVQDSNNIDQLGSLVGSWSELHFERVSRLDKRNYTCVAENKAAVAEQQAQLLVEYSPKLIIRNEAKEIYYSWIFTDEYGNSGNSASQTSRAYPVTFTCIADAEPKPLITWYLRGILIKADNVKYRLLRDELGFSQLEVNPTSLNDFGEYQCRAENRLGREERMIQLRQATAPKFAPLIKLKGVNPESVHFDIHPSDAPEADGGMPIIGYRIQWKMAGTDWTTTQEREFPVDLSDIEVATSQSRDLFDVELSPLLPDTEYHFRGAAVNKPGIGVWSTKELRVKTLPRRVPDPVRVTTKEDCSASTRCYLEWAVDSNGGSPIREYLIRWRRVYYLDPLFQHRNNDRIEPWSVTHTIKHPKQNYEITQLLPNSHYEVELLAKNDIGVSPFQPVRIRTLTSTPEEAEEFLNRNAAKLNKGVIIAGSVIASIILFFIIDVVFLMKCNCGLLALLKKFCSEDKANSSEYKTKSPPPKIAQHQPKPTPSSASKPSKSQYQPIKQDAENQNVTIPMNE